MEMSTYSLVHRRLVALQLEHLPPQVIIWIERDLAGVHPHSLEAILNQAYVVRAIRAAIRQIKGAA